MMTFMLGIVTGLVLAFGAGQWAARAADRKHAERADAEACALGLTRAPGEDTSALWKRIIDKRIDDAALEIADGALDIIDRTPRGPSLDAVKVGLRDGAPWGSA